MVIRGAEQKAGLSLSCIRRALTGCWWSWFRTRMKRRNIDEYFCKSWCADRACGCSGGGGCLVAVAVQHAGAGQAHRARYGAALQRAAPCRETTGDRRQPRGEKETGRGRQATAVRGASRRGRRLCRTARSKEPDVVP